VSAVSAPLEDVRTSDAELARLFPWLGIEAAAPVEAPAAAIVATAAPAGAAGAEEDDGDDGCCAICMDAERDTALEPCGHALLCGACALKVLRTAAPACPVCRVPATGCRAA
jgi:hypothetical protein